MAMQPQKRLVILLERCDTVPPVSSVRATPCMPSSPRVKLVDCLSLPKSLDCLVKVRKKLGRGLKRKKTGEMVEAVVTTCDEELCHDPTDTYRADQDEGLQETSVPTRCPAAVETGATRSASKDDQPPDSFSVLGGKVETMEPTCAPERLSLFDQMPLLLLENDDFFPVRDDPLLVDPGGLMLVGSEVLVAETGSRNSSVLGEYPAAEFFHELNNDVMLGDVANRSVLLEEEELLVPGGVISVETSAGENVEFGQNDFAIDDEMDWTCEQPWPLLEPRANLPEGHGLLNSSLEAGDSDDEFGQRMREEFLARRLRCSTRLQNQQSRSAERSLSESDNLDSDSKTVVRKRSRDVPDLDVLSLDIQEEVVHKKLKTRRIRSKSNDKVLVAIESTPSEVKLADGKTHVAEFPVTFIGPDIIGENRQSNSQEMDGLRQKKLNRRERISTEMKAKTIQSTNSLLTSQNEADKTCERGNLFRAGPQSSDEGKGVRKSVDVPAKESVLGKKHGSKENKGVPERASAIDVTLSKSLLSSVEAARQKYMQMKKEREANEPKELSAEEKAKKAKDVKNPCRESGCSAPARPDSIFCSSECVSRHVKESIKLLTQDRLKTYNRDQQPGISGPSDAAKATERVVVFERKTGKLVTGPLAPTESSLLAWLQRHPTFEVLQPEQATGHGSGNVKKRRTKLVHGGGRNGMEPCAVTRMNLSGGAPSDKTQGNSGKEIKLGASGRTQAAITNARYDLPSRSTSHSDDKLESGCLDPLRTNTRSELRHLLVERLDRDVSVARVKRLSVEIECELWSAGRGSSSLYKQKSSSLVRIFKRPSSQDLCRRLLCAEMKPRQLLQQMRELQRSGSAVTKNNTVSPLDLLVDLTDTTDRHGDHIFDVGCRICSGRLTRTSESERLQPPSSSNATCIVETSCDLQETNSISEMSVSANVEDNEGNSGDSGVKMFVCKRIAEDGESGSSGACVDSRHSNEGQSYRACKSQDLPPSAMRCAASVLSPGTSSDAFSSGISPVILSPIVKTSVQPSNPVQKPSCSSPPGHQSSHPCDIPSGFSSNVPQPSVELPAGPLPRSGLSSADATSDMKRVLFASSQASVRTSAPSSSLYTCETSVETKLSSEEQTQAPVVTKDCSVEALVPSKHSAVDVRCGLEGSSPAVVTSRPHGGSHRATSMGSGGPDVLVDLVWRGNVSALDGATMQLCAYRTSGSMKIIRSVLPATVTVMGRIDPKTVQEYLQKIRQQYTATREIAVICFHCHDNGDKAKYQQLFNYLQERRRCGVIGSIGSAIKDMYLWPLPSGASIPGVLLPFNGPGLDVNRSDVLLGIIIQQATTRSRPKQPTSSAPLHGNTVGTKGPAKISVEPNPAAQGFSSQDDRTPLSEIKNGSSPAKEESSDEISDDDLKAFAQADPIVSKYSKARPQDLLIPAKIEDDKPYDPFDEDYEIGSSAENPSKPNGRQKLTESIKHGKDVIRKPCACRKTSEMTSETEQTDRRSRDDSEKDAFQGAEKSRDRDGDDLKISKHDVDVAVCKGRQHSELLDSRHTDDTVRVDCAESSVCAENNANSESQHQETIETNRNVEEIKSRGLLKSVSHASKQLHNRRCTKVSAVTDETKTPSAEPLTDTSCSDESEMDRGGGTVDEGSSAAGMEAVQPSTEEQLPEVSNLDSASPETLTSIATILTQLSEKNALNQDILRSLLDQLLSVYGAQNDRQQRAILLQLVETIEKQHSVTEKQETVAEKQESVMENPESVTEKSENVTEKHGSMTEKQESVTEKQKTITDQQQFVAKNENMAYAQTGRHHGTHEEWHTNGGKPLVNTVERGPSNFQNRFHVEEGHAGDNSDPRHTKDVVNVPAVGGRDVESWNDGLLGKAAIDGAGPKANQGQSIVSKRLGLVCPEFKRGQNGMTIGRTECDIVLKLPQMEEEDDASIWSGCIERSGKMSVNEETFSNTNESIAEKRKESLAASEYPAMYQTDIQSRLRKGNSMPPAGCEGYDAGWFSPLHRNKPAHSIWDSEEGSEPWRHRAEDCSAVPQKTGELRSCLKKRKPEIRNDEQGISIEKILPVLSDSSFEAIKSIVKTVGVAMGGDPAAERPLRVDVEDQHRPMTAEISLSTDASFWIQSPSIACPLVLPPFPVHPSPERPLFSPTFSKAGRLPAPPKPPSCLLQGIRFRAPVPEAFGDSQMPMAQPWARMPQPHLGFRSPTAYNPCHRINPGYGNARLVFSPPRVPEEPSYPSGRPGPALWGHGRLQERSSYETPVDNWSYPLNHPRQGCLDTQPFWRSNNCDMGNSSNHQQCLAAERARGLANAVADEDFLGKKMIERNGDRCRNNGSCFPYGEVGPQQPPLFPNDQDYRRPFCDVGTKSLIDSTYKDTGGFLENSYEFFGSVCEDDGGFVGLGKILPGLGDLLPGLGDPLPGLGDPLSGLGDPLPGLGGQDTTDLSKKAVDPCRYPSLQTDVNEQTARFQYHQSNEKSAAIDVEGNQMLAAKADLLTKTDATNKSETVTMIGGDLKSHLTDHFEFNIGNDEVSIKTDSLACISMEVESRMESLSESERGVRTYESRCENSQKTVLDSQGVECEAASDHEEDEQEQNRLSETLARFSALIERCSRPKSELRSHGESAPLQELVIGDKTHDEARLIGNVSELVKRCFDSDLLSYTEICGGLGQCSPVLVEKGTISESKSLSHVEKSSRESVDLTEELRSPPLLSPRCNSPKIRLDAGVVDPNRSESKRRGSDSGGLNSAENSKPQTSDSNIATHISESDGCFIGGSGDDSKLQGDVPGSGDWSQAVVDRRPKATTKSTPDRVIDSSRVSSELCESVKLWLDESVKLPTRGRAFHNKSQPRTDSCDSSDSVKIRSRHIDWHSSDKGRGRDSRSSCESPKKRRHRQKSCDGSEKQITYRNPCTGKQTYLRDSSESGSHSRRQSSSSGSATKRKHGHDSHSHARKRSKRGRDQDEECDDLVFSSDESEQQVRVQRMASYGQGGSYQSSESDNQRVREKVVRSPVAVVVDDRLRDRAYDRRFEGRQSTRSTRPGMNNGRSHHRGRKMEEILHGGTRSPSGSSGRTVTGRERRRDCLEGTSGKNSADIDERTFHTVWKEIEMEERFEWEVKRHGRRRHVSSREGKGDPGERHRLMERTGDPRTKKRPKEDAQGGAIRNNAETVGLATFAGFISRRIPLQRASGGGKNLAVDTEILVGGSLDLDRKMGPSVSRDCRRRQDERLVRSGSLVTDAVVANHLAVGSTSGAGLRKSRDQRSSERKQMDCASDPVKGREETGHLVVGGQLQPNGQRTQLVPNLIMSSSQGPPAQDHLRLSVQKPEPHHVSGPRRNRVPPKKHPVKVSTNEELEEGEIVDAPNDGELPSATRDLLALLNAPIRLVGPATSAAAVSHVSRQQSGPSKT